MNRRANQKMRTLKYCHFFFSMSINFFLGSGTAPPATAGRYRVAAVTAVAAVV